MKLFMIRHGATAGNLEKRYVGRTDEGYIFGEEGRGFERINVASPRSVIEECMNRIRTAFEEEKLV